MNVNLHLSGENESTETKLPLRRKIYKLTYITILAVLGVFSSDIFAVTVFMFIRFSDQFAGVVAL